jgi:hypothetical protein
MKTSCFYMGLRFVAMGPLARHDARMVCRRADDTHVETQFHWSRSSLGRAIVHAVNVTQGCLVRAAQFHARARHCAFRYRHHQQQRQQKQQHDLGINGDGCLQVVQSCLFSLFSLASPRLETNNPSRRGAAARPSTLACPRAAAATNNRLHKRDLQR